MKKADIKKRMETQKRITLTATAHQIDQMRKLAKVTGYSQSKIVNLAISAMFRHRIESQKQPVEVNHEK